MTTPLYKDFDNPPHPKLGKDSHRGLWYERFFNCYEPKEDWEVDKESKMAWVKCIANSEENCGDSTMLTLYQQRYLQLATALRGKFRIFQTTWHFATGLGLPHPVENGFAWHPTLGVPYLAGSAIKGLLRAWLEWEDVAEDKIENKIELWLGSDDSNEPCAGQLIFFDALPIKPVKLTADVMTPHFSDWCSKGNTEPDKVPADWHVPVPIPFLAVKPNTDFLFMVAPRSQTAQALVAEAFEYLEDALEWLGAGAKTATGYGHMQRNEQTEDELKEENNKRLQEQADKNLSAEEKTLEDLRLDFEKARQNGDKKPGGTLSSSLDSAIKEAIEHWHLEWRQQLAELAEPIYKFQRRKKKSYRENLAKLRSK